MVAHLTPERDFRGAGCTEACEVVRAIVPGRFGRSELLLHDPGVHEEYGRATAGIGGGTVVWTGPLVVDRWAKTAQLGPRTVHLTGREYELLDHLAARLGRLCSMREIGASLWSDSWGAARAIRMTMLRLRGKLAPCPGLIETVPGRGYRLAVVPPVEHVEDLPVPPRPVTPWRATGRWAQCWERCACCGTTEREHYGHGRCAGCRRHARACAVAPEGDAP
jgi:DNA-binding winged helix-turn-helix (wHTH) protein